MKTEIMWRESVYKNNFRCSHCGVTLFDTKLNEPTLNLGVDENNKDHLHCIRCGTMVGTMRYIHGLDDDTADDRKDCK